MKYFFVVISILFVIPTLVIGSTENWKQISGNWDEHENWITPSEDKSKPISPFKAVRNNMGGETCWKVLNVNFRLNNESDNAQFGLLLNFVNKEDFQVLRICNFDDHFVIQMLRWQYGYFRMWQEVKFEQKLSAQKVYDISIQRAPLVDHSDWRQWKIILTDLSDNLILLEQGVENEQPAFGVGVVGLYAETACVQFNNFIIEHDASISRSKLKLAPLFVDHMVLQQNREIKVWGKSKANESIRIEIAGQVYQTTSNGKGDWLSVIPPLKAQKGLRIKVNSFNDSIIINDVAVGEVWLSSGQSNMEMRTWQTDLSELVRPVGKEDNLRFFMQPQWPSPNPQFTSGGEWLIADSSNVQGFSAVALSFALELREKLNVPVGIISSYWGGTAIESWIPASELTKDTVTAPIIEREKKYQLALEAGESVDNHFPECWSVPGQRHAPGYLYNGMIAPHIRFPVQGVIWYQGESNANRAKQYENLFPMLISSWRSRNENPDMYFFFVQLAGYGGQESDANIKDAWSQLRESQRLVLNRTHKTGMAVAIDLGQGENIHPPFKKEIGYRLSRLALHDVYDFDKIVRSSPLLEKFTFDEQSATIQFSEIGDGLKILNGDHLLGFVIANKDRKFFPAEAVINHDRRSVKVFNEDVKKPVAVRYAWENNPKEANLVNCQNLPAAPFRTDVWSLSTDNNR